MVVYTYLIGWTKHNKWYYGARWSHYAKPEDLWTTYFTSSKYVKEFRKLYSEPDVIEIRKIFETKEKCRLWEEHVIRKLNIVRDEKWLNKGNCRGPIKPLGSEPWNKGLHGAQLNPFKGKTNRYSEKTKRQISKSVKTYFQNISIDEKKQRYDKRDSCNSRRWMHNIEGKHIRVKQKEISKFVKQGWFEGRIIPRNKQGEFVRRINIE